MSSFVDQQIDAPSMWQEFEKMCCDIGSKEWNHVQMNGREGQAQNGVDVYGYFDGELQGIQCKGKDGRYGRSVTKSELIFEVKKQSVFILN